jgi:hypothetical protein
MTVAVLTGQGGRVVGIDGEFPHLKRFAGDTLVKALGKGDFIEQPIGSAVIGNMLGAVCIQHIAHQAVPVPMLAAGELPQVACGQCCRGVHV